MRKNGKTRFQAYGDGNLTLAEILVVFIAEGGVIRRETEIVQSQVHLVVSWANFVEYVRVDDLEPESAIFEVEKAILEIERRRTA